MEPNPPSQTLGRLYLMIDMVLALLLAVVLWPLIRMKKWHRWLLKRQAEGSVPGVRVVLRAVWEVSFALIFLTGIRMVVVTGLGAQSWYEVLTVFPDFVIWLCVFSLIILVTGVIRLRLILQTRQTPLSEDKIVSETPRL